MMILMMASMPHIIVLFLSLWQTPDIHYVPTSNGVADKVTFRREDLFKTDLSDATVVTLYLSNSINIRLRGILQKQLKPGTRIVSHRFTFGDWKPEAEQHLEGTSIYLWTIPTSPGREAR